MSEQHLQKNYPSADVSFDVVQREYEQELNRSLKLDNKINITLTFCGVVFLFVIKYLDFTSIFEASAVAMNTCQMCFIKAIVAFIQVAVIVLFLYAIIKLISLLHPKGYLHFNCDEIFDKKLMIENEENSKFYILTRYWAATVKNNETNEQRSEIYNKAITSLKTMVILCVVAEFIKMNFLGLGG